MIRCPDWSRLAAARDARDPRGESQEPEGWTAAVAHFDACALCRGEALKADPLLVFRRMPAMPAGALTPAEERLEVESMQQAVAAMRTARRLETRGRFAGWRRWAAAAVLTGVALGVGRDKAPRHEETAAVPPVQVPAAVGNAPVLDGIDRPGARVYHLDSEEMSAVMIVDESFAESLDV